MPPQRFMIARVFLRFNYDIYTYYLYPEDKGEHLTYYLTTLYSYFLTNQHNKYPSKKFDIDRMFEIANCIGINNICIVPHNDNKYTSSKAEMILCNMENNMDYCQKCHNTGLNDENLNCNDCCCNKCERFNEICNCSNKNENST